LFGALRPSVQPASTKRPPSPRPAPVRAGL
jgi:hypothetical protein